MSTTTTPQTETDIPTTVRYSMVIAWSDEDHAYLVRLPEWEATGRVLGPVAHGSSYTEAATEGTIALELLIGTANDLGWSLPPVE